MARSMRVIVPLVFLLLASIVATGTQEAVSCDAIVNTIYPCVPYVVQGGSIPAKCCNNIRMLKGVAKNVFDLRGVCGCLKSVLTQVSPQYLKSVTSLPDKCGVDLTYKIDASTDCNSIH